MCGQGGKRKDKEGRRESRIHEKEKRGKKSKGQGKGGKGKRGGRGGVEERGGDTWKGGRIKGERGKGE
ncbi:hypothetical protein CP959_10260 [Aliarcobacter skirrowii CCUG 10374]|uniref:Uncharacterized protein n=1 Tax=Aliarcobacter skirrowii CCUG 10374 TaxID=1032239 RepID=A0ABY0EHI7_9BACT|nr:hypothetical protein CP959_10260 [Aliarcobacter skirrowii CCUG 10374]